MWCWINSDPLRRYSLFSSVAALEDVVCREIFDVAGGNTFGSDGIDSVDEPPEDCQWKPHRLCLALSLRIISRFFVSCPSGSTSVASQTKIFKTPFDGLRFFRKVGGECCLALMITECSRYPLTTGDKQFAAWTLREAIVSSYQADPLVSISLLRWLVWLLNCPVADSASAAAVTGGVRTKFGSLENILLDREILRQGDLDGFTYAIPPSALPTIPYCVRVFVIQELRILLGGDDWEGILPANEMPNKLFCLHRVGHILKASKSSGKYQLSDLPYDT